MKAVDMFRIAPLRIVSRFLMRYRRFLRSMVGALAAFALVLSFGLAGAKASADPEPASPSKTAAALNPMPSDLATEFGKDWWKSKDFIITSSGDSSGMHYYIAREDEGYYWRPLASILPA